MVDRVAMVDRAESSSNEERQETKIKRSTSIVACASRFYPAPQIKSTGAMHEMRTPPP